LARKRRMAILALHKNAKKQRIVESGDSHLDETRNDIETITHATSTSNSTRIMTMSPRSSPNPSSGATSSTSGTCTIPVTPSTSNKTILNLDLTPTSSSKKGRIIKSSTKYQNRYEPEEKMSKEQLAEWRKEARRQRNRESAAASRNKVRSRIHELEEEVQDWKKKYESLLERMDALEKEAKRKVTTTASVTNPSSAFPSLPDLTPTTPKTIYVPSSVSACSDLYIPLVPDCTRSSNDNMSSSSPSPSPSRSEHQQQQSRTQSQTIVPQNLPNHVDLHVIEISSRPAVSK